MAADNSTTPTFEWEITVRGWNRYGDQVVSKTPTKILAATRSEVTKKVRIAFDATYDTFRKFWSHDWTLVSVREIATTPHPAADAARQAMKENES